MAAWGDHDERGNTRPARREPINLAGTDWRSLDYVPPPIEYWTCSVCGHVEPRPADVEPPGRCEHCRAHFTALVSFGDLDAAEAFSEGGGELCR